MPKNIVLIGFMGSGKSVAANELAKRLKRPVLSTDELIEKKEGRPITEIFTQSGEEYFRQLEQGAVAEAAKKQGFILDCGGGAFCNPRNIQSLKATGIVFYLAASAETLWQRTRGRRHRPLLNTADPAAKIEELLNIREPFYQQAHHIIETSGKTNPQVCDEIMKLLSND